MKLILQTLVWLSLCVASAAFPAQPDNIRLSYDVYKGSMKIGVIDEIYQRDNNRYTLTSTTRAVGFLAIVKPGRITITSSGQINKDGLKPSRFNDQREGDEKRNRGAEFDWGSNKLTLIQRAQRNTVALPEGTQDRLSAMYQFMFLSLQPGNKLDFPMTNGGKLDNYHYAISNTLMLETPAGKFSTLYLDSQPKPGEDRTEIWLATQQHNLPVKMIISDADGGRLTQVLSKIDIK